jgi:Helix-turn-helix domain
MEERCFMNDQKLPIPNAAKALGISPNALRTIIAEGRIPVIRLFKKKILILSSDVEKLLKDSRCFMKEVEQSRSNRLPPLPPEVINSPYLRGFFKNSKSQH